MRRHDKRLEFAVREMRLCVMVLESRESAERIAVIRTRTRVCEFYLREAASQAGVCCEIAPSYAHGVCVWPFSRGIE